MDTCVVLTCSSNRNNTMQPSCPVSSNL